IAPPSSPAAFAATFARVLRLDPALEDAMVARVEARYRLRLDELDVTVDAKNLHAPLLVIHDREDAVVPFSVGASIARAAPRGELVEVEGLGHRAILRAPGVLSSVLRFVDAEPAPSFEQTLDGELLFRDSRW